MPNRQRNGFIPTRFPGGINTTWPHWAMAMMGQPDPTRFITDFDDFITYTATDWLITTVGTGTRALVAGHGGLLAVTNSAAAPDANYYQRATGDFLPAAGKRIFFKTRLKVDNATLADIQVGLINADSTPLDATDGFWIRKAAGATTLSAVVRRDATTGSSSIANIGTMADDTFIELAFHYDGKQETEFFVNNVRMGSVTGILPTTFLPDTLLTNSFGILNGSAAARALTVDYVLAAQER